MLKGILVLIFTSIVGLVAVRHSPPPTSIPISPTTINTSTTECKDSINFGNHSFINVSYLSGAKKYLFDAAKRSCKKFIRFDLGLAPIEPEQGKFTWDKTDENVNSAKERNLIILGTLGYSTPWIVTAEASKKYDGAIDPNKYDQFIEYVKDTVSRYKDITYWEIWNEPDLGAYKGSPSEYAHLLSLSYDAIKSINPNAKVLIAAPGGDNQKIFIPGGWIDQIINDKSYPAKFKFDIANAHDRGSLEKVVKDAKLIRQYYNNVGRADAPLWITEHGFPADPVAQSKWDANFAYGDEAQADYLKKSLPLLISSGADKVFVTLRDEAGNELDCQPILKILNKLSPFCSEGLVTFETRSSTSGRNRPAMAVFQSL